MDREVGRPAIDEGLRLRRLRDLLGLTQRELALEMRVAHGAIATWESGKQSPPGPVLKLLELYEEELGVAAELPSAERLRTSSFARNLALTRAAANGFARAAAMALERILASDGERNAITARAHAAIARNLVVTLGDLKGAAMKVGQTLGYFDFTLPEAAANEFATLQLVSRHMSPATVTQVFLEEFGETPRALFAEWSPAPFAVASIGQVHRARLRNGAEVAVKVQYPRIVEAIDADLRSANAIDKFSCLLFRGQERGVLMAELRERFTEECDYRIEAGNLETFRRLWADAPGIRFPRLYPEFTRRRVLVTSFEHGTPFDEFARTADAAARNRVGQTLWRFGWESIFRHGVFHADPHAGNFLFGKGPDGDGELIVLDFGCTKRLAPYTISCWSEALRATLERRPRDVRTQLEALGFSRNARRFDFDAHNRLIIGVYEPWLRSSFEFSPEFAERAWRMSFIENPNKYRANVPRDFFFANRLQFGMYSLLGKLRASGDFRSLPLDLIYAPGEPRPGPFTPQEVSALLMT